MKRWSRNIFLASLIMIVVGTGLLFIGSVTGGTGYIFKNDGATINRFFEENRFKSVKQPFSGIHSIDVNLNYADLAILPSDDENYYVEYDVNNYEGKNPVSIEAGDGRLVISDGDTIEFKMDKKFKSNFKEFIAGYFKKNRGADGVVTIYVPKNKETSVLSLSGKIHMAHGDLTVNSVELNKLEVISEFGDSELSEITLGGSTNISSNSGDIYVNIAAQQEETVNIEASAIVGDVDSEFRHDDDENFHYYSRVINKDGPILKISSSSGDIEIE